MRKIAHISDLHFGSHSDAVAEALLRSISDREPSVIALSGDFTQRARTPEFIAARRFIDRIRQPKIIVPGNHDVPLYNLYRRFFHPFTKYDLHLGTTGEAANFYSDDEVAVLGVNTARRFTRKNGRISNAQINEILDILGALPRSTFKILVTHHPLASPEGAPILELAGRAVTAMSAVNNAGIHLLLSGHHHQPASGNAVQLENGGSVLVSYAGTAISTRTRGGNLNSYNLLEVSRDTVSVQLMEHVKGEFHETSESRYSFNGQRWIRA